jgi:hypothetical protein
MPYWELSAGGAGWLHVSGDAPLNFSQLAQNRALSPSRRSGRGQTQLAAMDCGHGSDAKPTATKPAMPS